MLEIQTKEKFTKDIDKLIKKNEGLTLMEAIIIYAERNDIEVENLSEMMTPSFRSRFETECIKLNLVKDEKYNPLPFLDDE